MVSDFLFLFPFWFYDTSVVVVVGSLSSLWLT